MGIESEQLVFDYLSRVGDLAHGTSMTAADRARLVGGLRSEIERMRAAGVGTDGKAAVRKVLDRLGKPEEVVSAALGGAPVSAPQSTPASGPEPGEGRRHGARRLRRLPQMRKAETEPPRSRGASPPHLAGMDELGPQESDPDWWRPAGVGRSGLSGARDPRFDIPDAFSGGIEVPEVFQRPPGDGTARPDGPHTAPTAPATPVVVEGGGTRAPLLGALFAARRGTASGPRAGGVVELLAAGLLVAGALLGSLVPLGLGWLAAYWSPRLSRAEAQWAALGVPVLTVVGGLVWLWGRQEGRWGEPLASGGDAMQQAFGDVWPVALRVAAVVAALYLVWRARRRTG
ncbi:hypothetical protein N566_02905 [Streptomycetaceae bacterium MP113-05]|nr:hypothetical protein N566_02905 [Streptomycetaceae bacterium MP113-05]